MLLPRSELPCVQQRRLCVRLCITLLDSQRSKCCRTLFESPHIGDDNVNILCADAFAPVLRSGMAPRIVASTDIALGLSVLFPYNAFLYVAFPVNAFSVQCSFPVNSFSIVLYSAAFLFSGWLVLKSRLRMACHTRPAKDRGILLQLQIYCSILSASLPMKSILFVSIRCILSREPFPLDLVFQPARQCIGAVYIPR